MKEVIRDLDFLIAHTRVTFSYYNNDDVKTVQFFCLCLVERLYAAATGLRKIVEQVEENIYLEYSAGLIIRTEILDFLVALKAYDIQCQLGTTTKKKEEIESEITEYCNEILADGLNLALSYAKDLSDAQIISEDDLYKSYRNISSKYSKYIHQYKEDNKKPEVKYKAKIGGKTLFIYLAKQPFLKDLATIYDTYLYYSRYEHFSLLSHEVIRETPKEKFARLQRAVSKLTVYNFVLCDLLLSNDSNSKIMLTQFAIAGKYVEDHVPKAQL